MFYAREMFSLIYCEMNNNVLPPSTKECNYGKRAGQTSTSLIKFIVNSINIYVFK